MKALFVPIPFYFDFRIRNKIRSLLLFDKEITVIIIGSPLAALFV